MTSIALPAVTRTNPPHLGVVALIVLALLSVVVCVSHPEAITAEYQTAPMVGP